MRNETIADIDRVSIQGHIISPVTSEAVILMMKYLQSLELYCKCGDWTHLPSGTREKLWQELLNTYQWVKLYQPELADTFDKVAINGTMCLREEKQKNKRQKQKKQCLDTSSSQ